MESVQHTAVQADVQADEVPPPVTADEVPTPVTADDLREMRAEMAALRAELQRLQQLQARSERVAVDAAASDAKVVEHRTSRRGMLRLAGAAAAGAAAAAVGQSGQAAAANTEGLFVGTENYATQETRLSYGSAANGVVPGAAVAGNPSAMLRVETNFSNSAAVYAIGSGHGIIADGSESGFLSYRGKYSYISQGTTKACLLLSAVEPGSPIVPKTPPPTRTDEHFQGELDVDAAGDLWWCVATGTPGTWRKLAGPSTAGAFHAIPPQRVYDSRLADGQLGQGANRLVSIKDGRDGAGNVVAPDVVPAGATAIAYNITVAGTVGAGFLAVAEGDATGTSASSINWSASGQLLANGLQVKIAADRTVRVFSGGAGTTDFIIDVVGYYR